MEIDTRVRNLIRNIGGNERARNARTKDEHRSSSRSMDRPAGLKDKGEKQERDGEKAESRAEQEADRIGF